LATICPSLAAQADVGRMVVEDCFNQSPPVPPVAVKGFVAYGGSWQAQDGVLTGGGDSGAKLLLDAPLAADCEVAAEVFLAPQVVWSGLITCVTDPGIGADRFWGYEVSVNPAGKLLRLGAHRNNFELIRDVPCDLPAGQWVDLSVRRQGSRLEVKLNGQTVVTHDDGNRALPAGKAGFRAWQGGLQCRNFRVGSGGTMQSIALEAIHPDTDAARWGTSAAWTPFVSGGCAEFRHEEGGMFGAGMSQVICLRDGAGAAGIANAGPTSEGLVWVRGQMYEGAVWAKSDRPLTPCVTAENAAGSELARVR
jgi:hypothetical protein